MGPRAEATYDGAASSPKPRGRWRAPDSRLWDAAEQRPSEATSEDENAYAREARCWRLWWWAARMALLRRRVAPRTRRTSGRRTRSSSRRSIARWRSITRTIRPRSAARADIRGASSCSGRASSRRARRRRGARRGASCRARSLGPRGARGGGALRGRAARPGERVSRRGLRGDEHETPVLVVEGSTCAAAALIARARTARRGHLLAVDRKGRHRARDRSADGAPRCCS